MSSGQHSWSLCSLLLLLGGSLGVYVTVHQELVNGTVGQSVLLPVSYTLVNDCCFPVSIAWRFSSSPGTLISCTVHKCSLAAGGVPSNCSSNCYPAMNQLRDIEFFPSNGSLFLRNLQLNHSGVYNITFKPSYQAQSLTLAVYENHLTLESPESMQQDSIYYSTAGVCSSIALILILLLPCCIWHRARQQKRRNTEQQQEAHMQSTEVKNTVTIYATIRESQEQLQPRRAPAAMHASMTVPGRPGQGTDLYSFLS